MASNPIGIFIVSAAAVCATALTSFAAPLPVETFARKPLVRLASISPDGRYLIYAGVDEKERDGLSGVDLSTMTPFSITLEGDEIFDLTWLTNDKVAFNVAMGGRWSRGLYTYKIGDKIAEGINDMDLTSIVSVMQEDRSRMYLWYLAAADHRQKGLALIDTDRRPVSGLGRQGDEFMVVHWVTAPPGEVHGWIPDKTGQVRIGMTFHKEKMRAWIHDNDDARWAELPIDMESSRIAAFTYDSGSLYVISSDDNSGTDVLRLFDLTNQTFGPAILTDPEFSFDDGWLEFSRRDKELAGVRYMRDGLTARWLSESFRGYQAAIDARLPGRINHILEWNAAETHFAVGAESDRQPPQFYLYNRDKGTVTALPAASPWIDPAQMQPMQTVRFKARDGLKLQGYLSLPAKGADGVKPALVVYPHGGPWARDLWGWNSQVQFLVNRGYAVFQPNYRGSTGFKDEVSGERSAFRTMYDDVADGTDVVLRSGLVDGKRVAIYGGSFGGYLAVAGAAFEPDRFKCAVSFAGVFDWAKIVDQSKYRRNARAQNFHVRRYIGDPQADAARFNEMSPIKHAAAIKIPLLLVHGGVDRVVEDEQTKDLMRVLKEHKIKHETLFFKDEGHGLRNPENEAKFLKRLEEFLEKNL